MSTITAIQEIRGIMEISSDGHVIARIRKSHYLKFPLEIHEEIDIDHYLGKIAAIQFADAYDAALTCLDFSAHSAREISNALRRKGYVNAVIEAVIARLIENHLIDDRRYVQRIVEAQSHKAVGLYAVKRKLRSKGISDEDMEATLEEAFDEDQQRDAAFEVAKKLAHKYESLPRYEARGKLSQALARRGFPWSAIEAAIEALNWDE